MPRGSDRGKSPRSLTHSPTVSGDSLARPTSRTGPLGHGSAGWHSTQNEKGPGSSAARWKAVEARFCFLRVQVRLPLRQVRAPRCSGTVSPGGGPGRQLWRCGYGVPQQSGSLISRAFPARLKPVGGQLRGPTNNTPGGLRGHQSDAPLVPHLATPNNLLYRSVTRIVPPDLRDTNAWFAEHMLLQVVSPGFAHFKLGPVGSHSQRRVGCALPPPDRRWCFGLLPLCYCAMPQVSAAAAQWQLVPHLPRWIARTRSAPQNGTLTPLAADVPAGAEPIRNPAARHDWASRRLYLESISQGRGL